ncbi:MAG TPA: hypothetical protein VJU15_04895 [Gemmatimonadales bacterium]|nr:hypothetical protein [Gemmatimonadales bacterium]
MPESSFDFGLDENMLRMFEAVRDALEKEGVDPFDRDAFLMHRSVVELVHGGRPAGGFGNAIDELTALIHLIFLFWLDGQHVVELSQGELDVVMGDFRRPDGPTVRQCVFVGVPGRRVWGSPTEAGPEPLDGWYAARRDDRLLVAAQFGGRPDRDGLTIVAVDGPEPAGLVREDGTPLFSPTLPGGARAGLYSLTGMEELLALAWRVEHWRAGKA